MNHFTYEDSDDCSIGTSLKGTTGLVSRAQIEEVFGAPTVSVEIGDSVFDKVSTEWVIRFEDDTVATIYDWKRYELGAPYMSELYDWHIGGNSYDAVTLVKNALKLGVSA